LIPLELLKKVQGFYIKGRFLANDIFSGQYAAAFKGSGMTFEEYREYTPGDEIRLIDWNVSARMDRPFVKLFREEREQTLVFLLDVSKSFLFGTLAKSKKDLATEIAALLAFTAIKSSDKVGLVLFSDRIERFIPPKKGTAHVWKVISEISKHCPISDKTNIQVALKFLGQVIHKRCIAFLISDFLDEGYETELKMASLRHELIPIVLYDQGERKPPAKVMIRFHDLESRQIQMIDFSHEETQKKLTQIFQKRMQSLSAWFTRYGLDSLFVETRQDYFKALLKFFKKREKAVSYAR